MAETEQDKQQPEATKPRRRRPLAEKLAEMQATILRGAAEVLEMREMEPIPAQLAKDHLIGAEQSLSRAVALIPAEQVE